MKGLDSGVDYYIVKPFAFTDLVVRIRALIRLESVVSGNLLRVGDLTFDTTTLKIPRNGAGIDLTAKECSLLEYRMRHPNQVLTRTMLAQHVWNYYFDNATNVIDVHIRNLPRRIEDPSYDTDSDIDGDGLVDAIDLAVAASNFGRTQSAWAPNWYNPASLSV